jgi:hypothetical protein
MIPADHMTALNDARLGFFVFGASVLLAASTVRYTVSARSIRSDWDLYLLIAVLTASTLVNSSLGELRGILFWAAAGLVVIWLRRQSGFAKAPGRQVVAAIAIAGSVSGAIAILAHLTGSDLAGLHPGYEPHNLDFSSDIGNRGVGLSGHPLRLGTITMLSALIAFSCLIDEQPKGRQRVRTYLVLSISLVGPTCRVQEGLGSVSSSGCWRWCAQVAGGEFGRFVRMALSAAVIGAVLWAPDSRLVYERIFGSAAHVGSPLSA